MALFTNCLTFVFYLLVLAVCGWEAYQAHQTWQAVVAAAGGALGAIVLAVVSLDLFLQRRYRMAAEQPRPSSSE